MNVPSSDQSRKLTEEKSKERVTGTMSKVTHQLLRDMTVV